MKMKNKILVLLLALSFKGYSQALTQANIPAAVQAQVDTMQVRLGLDSVQKEQLKQIQTAYYNNYLSIPDTAAPTLRRTKFLQYGQQRDSLTRLVLTPVQWTTHETMMKDREQQAKQRILTRRNEQQNQ